MNIYTRAYDRAAIKFRGLDADINFVVDDYRQNMDKVKHIIVYIIYKRARNTSLEIYEAELSIVYICLSFVELIMDSK